MLRRHTDCRVIVLVLLRPGEEVDYINDELPVGWHGAEVTVDVVECRRCDLDLHQFTLSQEKRVVHCDRLHSSTEDVGWEPQEHGAKA